MNDDDWNIERFPIPSEKRRVPVLMISVILFISGCLIVSAAFIYGIYG